MEAARIVGSMPVITGHMKEVGYSSNYIKGLERSARWLVEMAGRCGSWDEVFEAVDDAWDSVSARGSVRCQLRLIRQYDELGVLPRSEGCVRYARRGSRDGLCEGFSSVIVAYESSPEAASKKPTTVRGEACNASSFLARLQAMGRTSASEVTEDDLIEVLTGPDGGPAFSPSYVKQVKAVLSAAHGVEGCDRLAAAIPVPKRWRKVGEVLTGDERSDVEDALADEGCALSLRDRAIGRLLLHTGMRASDMASLELRSIDWQLDTISIVQQKTEEPLTLPLVPQVGNAIFDYLTGARGTSPDPHVFLSNDWPYGGMSAGGVGDVANKVLAVAGVARRGGARTFRRSLATAIMGDGIDRSVIAATLGHSSPRSTERYMVADVEGLRRLALDVSRFPVAEGVLR